MAGRFDREEEFDDYDDADKKFLKWCHIFDNDVEIVEVVIYDKIEDVAVRSWSNLNGIAPYE